MGEKESERVRVLYVCERECVCEFSLADIISN